MGVAMARKFANSLRRNRRTVLIVAVLLTTCFSVAHAQDNLEKWNEFAFAERSIRPAEVASFELQELKILRGIVFGRHGRVFRDVAIQKYLAGQSWYKPNPEFQNSLLNDVERKNLDLIREAEASKHENVEPGDMRYYRTRQLTRKQLGTHSRAEWMVIHAEIEAIHGKRFDDQPWLQQYFEERYWYKVSDRYDAKQLSDIERKNLQTIAIAHRSSAG
jgi:hypothetical protein